MQSEVLVLCRKPAFSLLPILVLALCQLLTPSAADPYAVLTVNGAKPLMAATPMLVCIAVLLGTLLFPVYVLLFCGAYRRQRRPNFASLTASSVNSMPSRFHVLLQGKMLAGALMCSVHGFVILLLCSLSIRLHVGSWPAASAALFFAGTLLPVFLLITLSAAVLGTFLREVETQVLAAFGLWIGLLLGPAFGIGPDLFGLRYICRNVAPHVVLARLSVGILPGRIPTVPWTALRDPYRYLASRGQLTAWLVVVLPLASLLLSYLARGFLLKSEPQRISVAEEKTFRELPEVLLEPMQWTPVAVTPWVLAQTKASSLSRLPMFKGLLASTVLLGLLSGRMRFTVPLALLLPLVTRQKHEGLAKNTFKALERTARSLWQPTPRVVDALTTALLAALPLLAVMLHSPANGFAVLQCVAALVALCGWLLLVGDVFESQAVAIAGYGFVWYCLACNQVPKQFDVLAVGTNSAVLLLVNLLLAGLVCLALAWADYARR